MKKLGILVFLAVLVIGLVVSNLFSFGRIGGGLLSFPLKFGSVKGSGNITTDHRQVAGFHAVDVGGIFQVDIVAQKEQGVDVEADDNLLPFIRTEVRNGVLKIFSDRRIQSGGPIRVHVAAAAVDDLDVSGAASVDLSNVKNTDLTVDTSGASKLKISGDTAKLNIEVSGASKIDAESLNAAEAVVDASGASHVAVNVTGTLKADASGASRVVYAGTPADIQKKTSGAGSVSAR